MRLPNLTPQRIALVYCALILAGCSASYHGERWFWKAQHLQTSVAKDLSKATPEQFAKLIEAFQLVTTKAPETIWAARAQTMVGSLYATQKEYAKARAALALVLQEYNQYQDVVLAARIAISKTYEVEQDWDNAIKSYQEISDYHPWSTVGLQVPLSIAAKYEQQRKPELAKSAYDRSIRFYTGLIPDAPTVELEAQAKGYLAQALERLGQWDQAAKTLEELLTAPKGANRPLTLLMLGSIYQTKLQHPEKAVELYQQLIREFPKHPYVKLATIQLQHLNAAVPSQPVTP